MTRSLPSSARARRWNTTSSWSAPAPAACPPRSASSSWPRSGQGRSTWWCSKKVPEPARTSSGRHHGPARAERTVPELEGARRAAEPARHRGQVPLPRPRRRQARTPNLLPACFHNHGNYIVSLGAWCAGWPEQAENLGVEIFPGFAAAEVLYNDDGSVKGVPPATWASAKDGEPANFQLGMELHANTPSSPRARGSTWASSSSPYNWTRTRPADLRHRHQGAVGVDPPKHQPGLVVHTAGWPLDGRHLRRRLLYPPGTTRSRLGFVIGLDLTTPRG